MPDPICFDCFGVGRPKACKTCGKRKKKVKPSNLELIKRDAAIDREEFIEKMREKAQLFGLKTLGSPELDKLL